MRKPTEYAALVADRKACHRCPGLTNPADVEGGSLDSEMKLCDAIEAALRRSKDRAATPAEDVVQEMVACPHQ